MWMETDTPNLNTHYLQVDAFADPLVTAVDDSSLLYYKNPMYVFNESKRKS